MSLSRRLLLCLLSVFFATLAHAQNYTSNVIFGDSLSDTGNVTHLSQAKYVLPIPGPIPGVNYTLGRFTDGKDTTPAATLYTGVWIEQLAASMANKPTVKNSLDGGTDYAYGYASTGASTSVLDLGAGLSVTVNNIGQQISDYLATNPTINNKTLFVVWGGAIDLLHAASPNDIPTAASNEISAIQTLINKGATEFLVANLPPLGLIPRNNTDPTATAQANGAATAFNQALAVGLAALPGQNTGKGVRIFSLDTNALFTAVVANPAANGLVNVTGMSQGNAVDPDTFLFWDDLHPTTTGHHLLAVAAASKLASGFGTSTSLSTTPNSPLATGSTYTLTATVSSSGGQASGTVTFYNGTTSLGTANLVAGSTSTTATASITATAPSSAGNLPLTATYAGGGGFIGSTSPVTNFTVVTSALTINGSSNVSIPNGSQSVSSIYSFTSVAGFTKSLAIACGTLPAHFTCAVSPNSLDLSDGAAHSTTVNITVNNSAALAIPARPGSRLGPAIFAATLLPLFGGLTLLGRRRFKVALPTLLLLLLLAGSTLGLSGCFGGGSAVPSGTYNVPLLLTTSSGATLTYNITVTYHPFL